MHKKFDLVRIDWVDSMHDSGWQKLSEFNAVEEQMMHRTVGYVVYESRTTLGVCQSYGVNRKDPTIDAVMQVPKVAIKKIKKLSDAKR